MKNVKIAIIVLGLLGALGFTFYNYKKEEPIPDTPETKTLWLCAACQHSVEWTTKEEYENARAAAPPLYCPACKALELYRAQKCPECGTPFFGADVPNSTGKCPKCNPEAKPIPLPEVEDQPEATEQGTQEVGQQRRVLKPI